MTMRGLDFGSGLADFSRIMSEGYRNMLELERQKQMTDYATYAAPQVIPNQVAQLLARDPMQVLSESYGSSLNQRQDMGGYITKPIVNSQGQMVQAPQIIQVPSNGGPVQTTPLTTQPQGDRKPQGQVDEQVGAQEVSIPTGGDDAQIQLAKHLGMQVKDGQIIASGHQLEQAMQTYDKLLGAMASVYGAARSQARPYMQLDTEILPAPRPKGSGAGGRDQRLAEITKQISAEQNNQKLIMAQQGQMGGAFGLESYSPEARSQIVASQQRIADLQRQHQEIIDGKGQALASKSAAPQPGAVKKVGTQAPSDEEKQAQMDKLISDYMTKHKVGRDVAERQVKKYLGLK